LKSMINSKSRISHISETNKNNAKLNITTKIQALRSLQSMQNLPEDLKIPKSIRAFNLWASQEIPKDITNLSFQKNALATLDKYPKIKATLIAILADGNAFRHASKTKSERIAALRNSKNLHRTLREISERALIDAIRETFKANAKIEELESQLTSVACEFRGLLQSRDKEIEELKSTLKALRDGNLKRNKISRIK